MAGLFPTRDALGAMPDASVVQHLGLAVADEGPTPGEEPGGELPGGHPSTSSGATGAAGPQSSGKPFILSEGLPPVPCKLVARILKGEFIDMAELLRDNLEAQRRASAVAQVGAAAASNAKSRREVPDLMSWVQCFGTYIAVVTSQFPHRIKELLAYQTLIVREARRCGGRGWLAYDSHFRQQVVGNEAADWSRLNQSLYAVTFITQGDRDRTRSCVVCLESDHTEEQCALYSLRGSRRQHRGGRGQSGWWGSLVIPSSPPGGRDQAKWHVLPGIKGTVATRRANTGTCVFVATVTTASLGVHGCGQRGMASPASLVVVSPPTGDERDLTGAYEGGLPCSG